MSAAYPIGLMIVVGITWFAMVIQHSRFLRAFRARYPVEAEKYVPYAFSWTAHPEKLFFIFRKWCRTIVHGDARLSRLRYQFLILLWLSLLLPACGVGAILAYALFSS